MTLWGRFKSRIGLSKGDASTDLDGASHDSPETDASAAIEPARVPGAASVLDAPRADPELARLALVGSPTGPTLDEAVALLRRVRGTPAEGEALSHALAAPVLPPPLRVACAEMLAARGESTRAIDLLATATTTDALVLLADLSAAAGQIPRAVGAIERVLARRIDTPGARERHARWTESLGVGRREKRHLDEATIVASRASQGPYRLLREVARGGAGVVYEAEDAGLQRKVAFKVYHGEGADKAAVEREIQMFSKVAGRGVARVYDASPSDGWIALEWAPRGSLHDVLRAGRAADLVPIESWARPLAIALGRVHRAGFVHADVKPANILLRAAGDPAMTDFGIAKRVGDASVGGSAGYLSPERLGGERASCLDDVYGFGRVIEDVLDRAVDTRAAFWHRVVVACLGPATHRPMDGAQLVALLGSPSTETIPGPAQ